MWKWKSFRINVKACKKILIAIGNEYFFKASDFYKISDNESLSKLAFFCLHTVILYVTFCISVFTIKGSNGGSYSRILTYVFVMFNSVGAQIGAPTPKVGGTNVLTGQILPKNFTKMKEIGLKGTHFWHSPLDPAYGQD